MHEDAKRMMADLGLATRDLVSAPEDHSKGSDAHKQAAARQAVASRRAQVMAVTANTKDERAAKLRAWNTESTFEQDGVTSQLEDRFGGQGHRAALQGRNPNGPYNERNEAIDNIVGEERRLYLQEHGGRAPNGRRGPAARDMVNSQGRGRTGAPASRVPSANAAPDPRAAGIVRFVRDEVVRQTGGDQRPSNNSTAQATATSSAPAVQPPAPQESSMSSHPPQLARPSSAIPIRAPSPSAESQASFSSRTTRGSGRRGGRGGPPGRPHKSTTPNTLPALLNPAAIDVYRCQALWYAARPGQESDLYHDRFPERKPFLDEAIEKLVKETVGLIKKDDGRDVVIYIETHRERAWMIDLARKARVVVEYSTQDEVERYCQDHPEEEAFVVVATSQFTSKIRRDSVLPAGEIMSNKPFPDSGESASGQVTNGFPSGIGEHKRTASGTESNKDVEMANTAPESVMHTETVVAEPEYLQANGAMQTQSSTPAQVSEAVINNATASKASNRVPKAKVAISNGNSSTADSSPAREANGSSVASGVTLPAASTMEEKGSLTALFFNKSHELIGMHQKAVQAPLSASLNLQCLDDHYDPHGLIKHIDILAQSMVERSGGASDANGANGATCATGATGANSFNLVGAYDSDSDEEL